MLKYLIVIILIAMVYICIQNKETFQNYVLQPYGYVKTGADPMYFYNRNRYRKPYRWPFKFYSSYPYSHMSPLE